MNPIIRKIVSLRKENKINGGVKKMFPLREINTVEKNIMERKKMQELQNKIMGQRNNIGLTKGLPDIRKRQFIRKGILGIVAGVGLAVFSKMARAGGIKFAVPLIESNSYLNRKTHSESKKCKGRVAQRIEPLSHVREDAGSNNYNKYLNIPNKNNSPSVVERVRSLTDRALLWLRRGCGFEYDSEIPPCPHSYSNYKIEQKEIKNRAHNPDKTPIWLRRVSHEFLLDSEIAESHTLGSIELSEYKNLSVSNNLINNSIIKESIMGVLK